MSDDKMREAFEEENPVPKALIYQDFTDTYEFEHEEHTLTFKQKSGYNEAYTHFEEGWDAALTHHQAESEPAYRCTTPEETAEIKQAVAEGRIVDDRAQPAAQVEEWRHDSESLEALHMNLDKAGVPREEDGVVLSEWGRVCRYKPAVQVPEGWEAAAKVALDFANCPAFGKYPDTAKAHIEGLAKLLLTAAPSIAEKRELECSGNRTRTVQVGEKLFEFSSQQDWVNKGPNIWKRHQVRGEDVLVVDQLGRTCRIGQHFREAEEDGAYPIEVFRHRPEPPEVE